MDSQNPITADSAPQEKTAVIYARVSTVRQAEEELPVQSQITRCKEKALQLGATVQKVFTDEGLSGTTDARPAFRDAIAHAELLQPDFFIVWSTSRFARNKVDAGLFKLRLHKAGVELMFVSQSIDRNTDAGWMTESVLEIFDEFYSRQISSDTIRSMVKNARDGYWNGGRSPFGYHPVPAPDNPKRKKLAIEAHEAALVREIFEQRAAGKGTRTIALSLNERGYTNRGKQWNKGTVSALLRNEVVIGNIVFGRRDRATRRMSPRDRWIIVPSHEPIIEESLWSKVQALMQEATVECNTGSPQSTYLFTGILHCADGSSMQIESAKGRNQRYYYYNCRSALKGNGKPNRLPARELDAFLLGKVLDTMLTLDNLRFVIDQLNERNRGFEETQAKRRKELQKAIDEHKRRNSNIVDMFERLGADTPDLDELSERMQRNTQVINELQGKLVDLDVESPPARWTYSDEDLINIGESLHHVITTYDDPKGLRAFFRTFIDRIDLEADKVSIKYRPDLMVGSQEPITVPSNLRWLPDKSKAGTNTLTIELPEHLIVRPKRRKRQKG